jgi:endonuclease/exonuclease/phosphatase family metal-dependent hydrolase
MTFNVKQHNPANQNHANSPTHWNLRKDIVFDVIRNHSPDILALQEPYRHQLDDLATAFPGFDQLGDGRAGEGRGEHCSILYRNDRFRPDESGTFWLSDTPAKPSKTWGHFYHRICTWARLVDKKSGRALYVFNTHFDHKSQPAREKSARLIARRIAERRHNDPFILTGDFNADEDNPVITYLTGKHAEISPAPVIDSFRLLHPDQDNVGTGNQFTGRTDGIKSDYIFVPPGTKVIEAAIIRTHRNGRYPSDHFPVTARIRIIRKAPAQSSRPQ